MANPTQIENVSKIASKISEKNNNCFVIMSFSNNPILESYYEEAVKSTVEEFSLKCLRVDQINFTGTITDKIKKCIEESKIIIVDLTEDKPNCYFEAGYAVAKNKKIIFQRLDAPLYPAKFEFDLKDYPHIVYTTTNDLRIKLQQRIKTFIYGDD